MINALTDGKSAHIPYRNSVLTRMLQDSIGGNSKTTLIITCSPSEFNLQETIGTLRFGERAKKIKNMAKINREMTVAELTRELDRTNKKMEKLDRKIKFLEEFIVSKNLELPHFDEDDEKPPAEKREHKKPKNEADGQDEGDEEQEEMEQSDESEEENNTNLKMQIEHNEKQVEMFEKVALQYEERVRKTHPDQKPRARAAPQPKKLHGPERKALPEQERDHAAQKPSPQPRERTRDARQETR